MLLAILAAACALAVAGPAEAAVVQLNWTERSTTGPAPRTFATMALSPNTADLLFGGSVDGSVNGVNDTWQFDGTSWSEAHPSVSPPARVGAVMAYDPDLNRTILFGGYVAGAVAADTWAWDGVTWQQLSPAHAPPARALAALTYDRAHHQLVLFGGSTLSSGSAASGLLGDTWAFDGDWHLLNSPGTGPSPRDWSAIAYDDLSAVTVLFGGFDGSALGDTWTWDGVSWTQQSPAHSPGPRYQHTLVHDLSMNNEVLLNGVDASGQVAGAEWWWDGDWHQLATVSAPSARTLAAAEYDQYRQEEVVFGGADSAQPGGRLLGDTWTGQPGLPVMSVSATTLDFGKVNVLDTADRTLTVSNSGSGVLQIAAVQLGGPDVQPFSITADACTGASLVGGASCSVAVRYQYSSTQSCSNPCQASLAVRDAYGGGVVVQLTAIETVPSPYRSPTTVDFGTVPVGTTASQDVTLGNAGTGDLLISRIYAAAADFGATSNCPMAPAPLSPGAACTIRVSFAPVSAATENSQIVVLDNLPPGYEFYSVGGTGVKGPVSLSMPTVTGMYGGLGSASVTATAASGAPLAGLSVALSLPNGATAQATTGLNGVATFAGLGLTGINAETYPSAATATFSGDASHLPATVSADLAVAPATVSLAAPSVTPKAPNTVLQFSDSAAVSTSVTAATGGVPAGQVTFTVNGHALAPVVVGPDGTATAIVRLDPSAIGGAGTYPVAAAFVSADANYTSASGTGSFTVAPKDVKLTYTGTFIVDAGSIPTLSVSVDQASPPGEYIDFGAVPIWVRFDVTGPGGSQVMFARVTASSDWSQTGRGTATATPSALANGAYTVAVHAVASAGASVTAGSAYVDGDGVRVGATVSPTNGSYTSGGGYLASDPSANAGDTGGYFAFVATSRSGQLQGSAMYSYRASINEGGQARDVDVWMSSTSVTAFGPAGKGAAEMAGACLVAYVDSVTGLTYGDPTPCSYSITDTSANGSGPAQFAIAIKGSDGSVLHAASGSPVGGALRVHL